jgi:hypothetical protein
MIVVIPDSAKNLSENITDKIRTGTHLCHKARLLTCSCHMSKFEAPIFLCFILRSERVNVGPNCTMGLIPAWISGSRTAAHLSAMAALQQTACAGPSWGRYSCVSEVEI